MRTTRILASLYVIIVLPCVARAQHSHAGDFELTVEFDSIIVEPRVLPAELHAGDFFSTDEPGFDSEPGSFPAGTSIGFNILDALKRWNGSGFDRVSPGTEEVIVVSFLQQMRQTGSGFVAGFDLTAAADGSWHRHLMFTLSGGEPDTPHAGIYLLALELYSTSPHVKGSYPIYVVFNVDDEPNHEAALEWVHNNLAGPVCMQKPAGDLNGDCTVDFQDFALLADSWLTCNLRPQSKCWH